MNVFYAATSDLVSLDPDQKLTVLKYETCVRDMYFVGNSPFSFLQIFTLAMTKNINEWSSVVKLED